MWAVAFTAAGDLVSGCSDAVARVWSGAADRQVSTAAVAAAAIALSISKDAAVCHACSAGWWAAGNDVERNQVAVMVFACDCRQMQRLQQPTRNS